MGRLKRFGQELGKTFNSIGAGVERAGKVLENMDKADKEMNEKIKRATGGIE